MLETEIFERVQPVIAAALNVHRAEITPETQFGDLPAWDSMGHMELIVSLEAEFGIAVNADTISELVTVAAICNAVRTAHA
jgi:acyl carrier protein